MNVSSYTLVLLILLFTSFFHFKCCFKDKISISSQSLFFNCIHRMLFLFVGYSLNAGGFHLKHIQYNTQNLDLYSFGKFLFKSCVSF